MWSWILIRFDQALSVWDECRSELFKDSVLVLLCSRFGVHPNLAA